MESRVASREGSKERGEAEAAKLVLGTDGMLAMSLWNESREKRSASLYRLCDQSSGTMWEGEREEESDDVLSGDTALSARGRLERNSRSCAPLPESLRMASLSCPTTP